MSAPVGKLKVGGLPWEMVADTVRTSRVQFGFDAKVPKLSAYVDGLGSGNGEGKIKAVLYDAAGNLIALGSEVIIPKGLSPGWVDLPFEMPGGITVPAAVYDVGLIAGGDTRVARVFGDDPGVGTVLGSRSLTQTGGEITDAVRAQGSQGDGRGYVQVTNLAMNGDFETDLSNIGWNAAQATPTQDKTVAMFGGASCKFTASGAGSPGIYLKYVSGGFGTTGRIPIQAGMVYTASVYVNPSVDTTFAPVVEWYRDVGDGIGTTRSAISSSTGSQPQLAKAGQWTRIAITVVAPLDAVGATPTFYAQGSPAAGTVWWYDGAQFEAGFVAHDFISTNGAIATQTQRDRYGNLIRNGGLETGTTNCWFLSTGSGTVAVDGSVQYEGTSSLKLTSTNGGAPATVGAANDWAVVVVPDTTYSGQVRVKGPAGKTATFLLWETGGAAAAANDSVSITLDGTWQQITVSHLVQQPDRAKLRLEVYLTAAVNGDTLWIDAAQLEVGGVVHSYAELSGLLPLDSSFGVYPATTNILSNPDFEAGTSGWLDGGAPNFGSVAIERSLSRFGLQSLRSFATPAQTLTKSGAVIDDAYRATCVDGDGKRYEYVYNLCPNSGAEVNTNYWFARGAAANNSLARDTTYAKFGSASFKLTSTGEAADGFVAGGSTSYTGLAEGANAIPVQGGATYTMSAWFKIPVALTGSAPKVSLRVIEWGADGTTVVRDSRIYVASTNVIDWTRHAYTVTLAAATAKVSLRVNLDFAVGSVWFDGVQFEAGSIAHDHVSTTTGPAGAIQGPIVTNHAPNSSFEYDTQGWGNIGVSTTVGMDTAQGAQDGIAAAKIVTPNVANGEGFGMVYSTLPACSQGQTWTASIYVKGSGNLKLAVNCLDLAKGTVTETGSVNFTAAAGAWTRVTLTYKVTNANSAFIQLTVITNGQQGVTFWADAAQLEKGYVANAYVPGSGHERSTGQAGFATVVAAAAEGSYALPMTSTNLCPNSGAEGGALSNIGVTGMNAPTGGSVAAGTGTGLTGTFQYRVSEYSTNANGTFESVSTNFGSVTVTNQDVIVNLGTMGNGDATGRKIYRSSDGGATWRLVATVAGVTVGLTYDDTTPDGSLSTATLPSATAAVASVATDKGAKFGTKCFQAVCPGAVNAEGLFQSTAGGLARAAGTPVIGSAWLKGQPGQQVRLWLRVNNTDGSISDGSAVTYTFDGSWQHMTSGLYAVQAGKTGDSYSLMVRLQVGTSNVPTPQTFLVDGMQIEERHATTPYIFTNGAAATRTSSFALPSTTSTMQTTQSFVAMRVRALTNFANWTSSDFPALFAWNDASNPTASGANQILCYWNINAGGRFQFKVSVGGVVQVDGAPTTVNWAPVEDEETTIVVKWDSGGAYISIGGAPFVKIQNAPGNWPSASALASQLAIGGGDFSVQWVAYGVGKPTDADAATLAALPSGTDPVQSNFSGDVNAGAGMRVICPLSTTAYTNFYAYPTLRTTGQVIGTAPALTVTGNERTDVWRNAGLVVGRRYDGLTSDGSFGVDEATTNYCKNGAFATNTTGWGLNNAPTLTRDTTVSKSGIGTTSGKVTTPGAIGGEGIYFIADTGTANPGETWTASAWVNAPVGATMQLQAIARSSAGANLLTQTQNFTGTGTWQRVTATLANAPASTSCFAITIYTQGTAQAITYWVVGAQIEKQSYATDYVHTDGAAATRAAGGVQAPASVVGGGAATFWVATRVRLKNAYNAGPTFRDYFRWTAPTGTDTLCLQYRSDLGKFEVSRRQTGQVANDYDSAAQTFAAGTVVTLIAAFTPTQIGLSINGAPFQWQANTNGGITGLPSTFQIGWNQLNSRWSNDDILYFAAGSGTLADADAANVYAQLNAGYEPRTPWYPTAAAAGMHWKADTTATGGAPQNMTWSAHVLAPAGQPMNLIAYDVSFYSGAPLAPFTAFTGTGRWQRVSTSGKVAAGETFYPFVQSSSAMQSNGGSFWVDGAQVENVSFATPYTPTSRGVATLTLPSSLLEPDQGWVAMRMRMGEAAALIDQFLTAFQWTGTGTDNIIIQFRNTGQNWKLQYDVGGVFLSPNSAGNVPGWTNAGESVTVVVFWSRTTLGVSVNGQPFVTLPNTAGTSPAMNASMTLGAGMRGEILWTAMGLSVPSNADAAALHAFGDTDPTFAALPAQPSMLWGASDANYLITVTGKVVVDSYSDGAAAVLNPNFTPLDEDLSLFATTFQVWQPPSVGVDDFYRARLPFPEAQAAFAALGPRASSSQLATVGWHGSNVDAERGSFAIVQSGGPLDELVGRRIRITTRAKGVRRTVYAFVHSEADVMQDMTVTRRLFQALAPLGEREALVTVETVDDA